MVEYLRSYVTEMAVVLVRVYNKTNVPFFPVNNRVQVEEAVQSDSALLHYWTIDSQDRSSNVSISEQSFGQCRSFDALSTHRAISTEQLAFDIVVHLDVLCSPNFTSNAHCNSKFKLLSLSCY